MIALIVVAWVAAGWAWAWFWNHAFELGDPTSSVKVER